MNTEKNTWTLEILCLILLVGSAIFIAVPGMGFTVGPNYRNVTVDTILNITNSFPEVLSITIDPDPLTLNAGTTTTLVVNATIRDFDGFGDIVNVTAIFFDNATSTVGAADDNNNHYTNGSCTQVSGSGIFANYTCQFDLQYYANNASTWTANVSAFDTLGFNNSLTNASTINALLALNVTPLIDFGDLAVGDISPSSEEANVTNYGNTMINVSVYGFGNVTGDGLAMVCSFRNISIANERFSLNASEPFATMTALSATAQHIPALQLIQRTNDTAGGEVINQTYWRIQVPVATNPAGTCNGSVVFQAELP